MIIAIDLAVIRIAFFGTDSEYWAIFGFCVLPVIDLLAICSYRLRRRERRTAGAVGFIVGGLTATLMLAASCLIAPDSVWDMFRAIARPIALSGIHRLTRVLGNEMVQRGFMQITLGVTFELLLPMTLFCAPLLVVAILGWWLARSVSRKPPIECLPGV
jgi:hypothetical protein